MKKLLMTSAAVFAASAFAGSFETWDASVEGSYRVMTNATDDPKNDDWGYWFSYVDDAEGGQSKIEWPVDPGNEYSATALDPIIDKLKGVGGTYTLAKGGLTYDPFVGIGVNVGGTCGSGCYNAVDATAWGGFCVSYSVDHPATIELGVTSDVKDDNPAVTAAKGAQTDKCYAWSEFKQAGWGASDKGGVALKGDEAAKQLTQFKFKIQGADASTGNVVISKLGPKVPGASASVVSGSTPAAGGNDNTPTTAIVSSAVAPVKAMLSGRTLSFSGISSVASVEVINLQGRVVVKGSAASSLNLANLDAGIYMVRVAGKSVDFAQKIVLK